MNVDQAEQEKLKKNLDSKYKRNAYTGLDQFGDKVAEKLLPQYDEEILHQKKVFYEIIPVCFIFLIL